jgi:hypothetical protein
MKRLVTTAALVCSLGLLATAYGQTSTNPDKVFYYDKVKKQDTSQTGKIADESPSKITMDNKLSFAVSEVKDVSYIGRLALDKRAKYGAALTAEENIEKASAAGKKAAIETAIAAYEAAMPDVKTIPFAQRHFDYKIASLTARLAGEEPKKRKDAIDLLIKFQKSHADGWQITRAVQRLADLQIAAEDFKGATATLKALEKMKGVPDDVQAAIPGRLVDVLISAKEFKEASAQIDTLLKGVKADSPEAFALKLKKIQVDGSVPGQLDKTVKQIDDMIKAAKDRKQLAVCYNTKGQLLLSNNRGKEALYEFLYVDLIYNDDAAETGKACFELAKLFDKIKQPARAKEYAEKADRLRK